MNNKFNDIIGLIFLGGILSISYLLCFIPAKNGYGFPDINNYQYHPNYSRHHHYRHFYSRSHREKSLSGNRYSSRGYHGGK